MPTKQKTAAKTPLDPHLKKVTFSIPTALLAEIDAFAKETGISRATLMNKILLECTSPAHSQKPPRPCPRGHIRPCDLRRSHIPNDTMKTNPIGHFPSGQPILPVRQSDRSPKRVFVLGVYASAIHARWISPEGRTRIAALAVASEPEIFWTGLGVQQIIDGITPPDGTGRLEPAGTRLNGPSGRALDENILSPLGLSRSDAWLCDLVPHSCMNPSQEAALRREGLPIPDWPRVPTVLADNSRRLEILAELVASQASLLITLGDQPLRWFASHFDAKPRLSDYGETATTYGRLHPIVINGRTLQLIPLAHPRQIARLGAHSDKWAALHAAWQANVPTVPLNF